MLLALLIATCEAPRKRCASRDEAEGKRLILNTQLPLTNVVFSVYVVRAQTLLHCYPIYLNRVYSHLVNKRGTKQS